MKNYKINILSLIIFSCHLLFTNQTKAQVNTQDSLALVQFYNDTDGPNWLNNTNWLNGSVSTWNGITVQNNRVDQVVFYRNGLSGDFSALSQIDSLSRITLFDQDFDSIPSSLQNLTKLNRLEISNCGIKGAFPSWIMNMIQLTVLDISRDSILGPIPASIGNLINLNRLSLGIKGDSVFFNPNGIPESIGKLNNLSFLSLQGDFNEMSIPDTLKALSNLSSLYLDNCNLSGDLPNFFTKANFSNLRSLHLNDNQFTGPIFSKVIHSTLENLNVSNNNLVDSIPDMIDTLLPKIKNFYVHQNQLSGTIPNGIGNLSELRFLNISFNNFRGNTPSSMGRLQNLSSFNLNDNQISSIHDSIAFSSLQTLIANDNVIVNAPSLINSTSIRTIFLQNNQIENIQDYSSTSTLSTLLINNNKLSSFEDIEVNAGAGFNFQYANQKDSVLMSFDSSIAINSSITLSSKIGGASNTYAWILNGIFIPNATDSLIVIDSFSVADTGIYTCQIRNSVANQVTFYRKSIRLGVKQVGISEINTLNYIKVYPNPSAGEAFSLDFELSKPDEVRLEIHDATGKLVYKTNSVNISSFHSFKWSARNVEVGIYFYTIKGASFEEKGKLILLSEY